MIDVSNGVPGINAPKAASYREFWPYYLSQHLHPMTQRVHAVATTVAVVTGISSLFRGKWKLLAASPLLAYGPAFASHFIWEGNKPVTLNASPFWAALADFEQVYKVFTGKIRADADAVREGLGIEPPALTIAQSDKRDQLQPAA